MRKCLNQLVHSSLVKSTNFFFFNTLRNNSLNSNNFLTHDNQFLNSSLKSRQFKLNQSVMPFPQFLNKSINQFPYCKLPKFSQKFGNQNQLSQEDYEKYLAFNCLFLINQKNKQRQLNQIARILLKQDFQSLTNDHLTGPKLFTLYYSKKLLQFVEELNKNASISTNTKIFYLQVLTNLQPTPQITKNIQIIKQEKILTENSYIQSLYLKLILKHQLPYIHLVDKLYAKLTEEQTKQSNQNNQQKINAAKMLLTIQNFEEVLSQGLKNKCLNIIIENMNNLSAFDHLMVIKFIYMSFSPICKQYIQLLTNQIMKLHKQQRGDEIHVPLVLKVIKYRSKLRLSNKMLSDIINSYPQKFNTVFKQKNTNKQIFMSVISKQSSNTLNVEIRSEFGSFIKKTFEQYQSKQEIDEQQLVRNIKLVLKYGNQLNKQQVSKVIEILVNNLYERTKHAASQQLKYYMFLVSYTLSQPQSIIKSNSLISLVRQVTQIYHNKCLTEPTEDSLSKAINIEYQLCRKQVQQSLRLDVLSYDYQGIQLHSRVYSYLFFLIKREKSEKSNSKKLNVINQLKKNIYRNLNNGHFSMKVLYTLVDILDELKFDDKYIYMDIEKAIAKNLQKAIQKDSKGSRQIPLPKDISFLKNKLAKNQKCSKKFGQFLFLCEKNYDLINEHLKDYLFKAKNWENIRQNYKRNRQTEKK